MKKDVFVTSFNGKIRLSVPGPGRTIQSTVTPWTKPLAAAFESIVSAPKSEYLRKEIATRYRLTFSPIMPIGDDCQASLDEIVQLASSAILSFWMLAKMVQVENDSLSFSDAERWFLGDSASQIPGITGCGGHWPPEDCLKPLSSLSFGWEFEDLLPYIFEVFQFYSNGIGGPTKASSRTVRAEKRHHGVFYTPSDVAEFIVRQVLKPWGKDTAQDRLPDPICLDPACGTGVFLLAVLTVCAIEYPALGNASLLDIAVRSLYGMDKNQQAIQSCVFAILSRCMEDISARGLSPWRAWQAIRGNFAVADSTLVMERRKTEPSPKTSQHRSRLRTRACLLDPKVTNHPIPADGEASTQNMASTRYWSLGGWLEQKQGSRNLGDLFEECTEGFSIVVGNPPYTSVPQDGLQAIRQNLFVSAPGNDRAKSGNLYTLFVEMMWRLARSDYARAGMVVPLSIAYNSGRSFQRLRGAIEKSGARWRFAFFDRTPDSLFGDNVKTRNAIVLMELQRDSKTAIETGPLQRWNSRNRSSLFETLKQVPLGQASIRDLIPKLGSPIEVAVYGILKERREKLGTLWRNLSTSALTPEFTDDRCVFYYSTAYNWLPIFRHIPVPSDSSASFSVPASLHGFICNCVEDAEFVFAVASSRLAYWLWRVEGDGFHLNRRFLAKLPLHPSFFPRAALRELIALASDLGVELLKYPIENINAGRRTINYSPHACGELLDKIDYILIEVLELPNDFKDFLREFVTDTIVAGRENEFERNPIIERSSKGKK
jgi:hypothetical protein